MFCGNVLMVKGCNRNPLACVSANQIGASSTRVNLKLRAVKVSHNVRVGREGESAAATNSAGNRAGGTHVRESHGGRRHKFCAAACDVQQNAGGTRGEFARRALLPRQWISLVDSDGDGGLPARGNLSGLAARSEKGATKGKQQGTLPCLMDLILHITQAK